MGELSKIGKGFTPSTSNPSFWDGELYWLSIADLNQGKYIKQTSKKISLEGSKNKDPIEKGTLLMSFKLSLGKLGILTKDMYTNEAICNFKWKNNNISTEYMYYYLSSINIMKYGSQAAKGITLNNETLNTIPVILPNFDEQNKISNFLSKIDKKIELLEKKHQAYEDFKKYLMQQIFTQKLRFDFKDEWKITKLGEITKINTGNKDVKDKIDNGKYPFFVRSEKVERINSYSFDGEAILIPGDGKIGEVYHYINGKFDYHQRVYKISDFKNNINGKYIYYYLEKNFLKQALKNSAKATVDSLRMDTLTKMPIELPSFEEQVEIVDILSLADEKIGLIEKNIKISKHFKRGLLQQMFV